MALFAVAAAFILSTAAQAFQGWNLLRQQVREHEARLVLEAVRTGPDIERSRANLEFLVDAGLLVDWDNRLSEALSKEGSSLNLPPASAWQVPPVAFDVEVERIYYQIETEIGRRLFIRPRELSGLGRPAAVWFGGRWVPNARV